MKNFALFVLVSLASLILFSCKGNDKQQEISPKDMLYRESVKICLAYIDSMSHAKDSVTVNRLMKQYDEAMTKVNYKYPPETFISIPQSNNDTLSRLSFRIIELRDSILFRLAHPLLESTDSYDTISNNPVDEL